MKTDQEILARIEAVKARDWLGTQTNDLAERLSFTAARPLLKEDSTEESWGEPRPRDEETVKAEMRDYMEFAWGKANNRRGISAGRSIDHMSAWLWLLGRDAAADQILEYDKYGKPWLRAICEEFGWDWRQWDDGFWADDSESNGSAPPESVPPLANGSSA